MSALLTEFFFEFGLKFHQYFVVVRDPRNFCDTHKPVARSASSFNFDDGRQATSNIISATGDVS